jgi:hypothetical protein
MVRTIPRELAIEENQIVNAMSTCLVDMASFAYDTGADEGISTSIDDFAYLDTSDKVKSSVTIREPSIGAPNCEGRGPLVYTFKVGNKFMGWFIQMGYWLDRQLDPLSFVQLQQCK